jgi:hypothetical protein
MVMFTTAVYETFDGLDSVFSLSHWAELTDYTRFYNFAIGYVFEKQSEIVYLLDSILF